VTIGTDAISRFDVAAPASHAISAALMTTSVNVRFAFIRISSES